MRDEELLMEILRVFSQTDMSDADQDGTAFCKFCRREWGFGNTTLFPVDYIEHEPDCLILAARKLYSRVHCADIWFRWNRGGPCE